MTTLVSLHFITMITIDCKITIFCNNKYNRLLKQSFTVIEQLRYSNKTFSA